MIKSDLITNPKEMTKPMTDDKKPKISNCFCGLCGWSIDWKHSKECKCSCHNQTQTKDYCSKHDLHHGQKYKSCNLKKITENQPIQEWERVFRLRYVPNCGKDEVCQAFYNSMTGDIRQFLTDQKEQLLEKIDKLIAEEMITATESGQPTSRLTSLAMKISKL